ncbi:uncharacterized protein LOC122282460 [Carya illinoinensis]|uniref:uncharacterized protein LOC122282460 n=1 Tax=Carya illinoinensis TaxID=32201 RepID=UPI001C71ADD0|nr:uncharacterized protein LOC122282460 [Carya illinoinensis]
MDKAWMHIEDRLGSNEYGEGVRQFMAMAQAHAPGHDHIRCPCRRCRNRAFHPLSMVEDHLFIIGIEQTYTKWIFHGEDDPFLDVTFSDDDHVDTSAYNDYIDDMDDMLDDIFKGGLLHIKTIGGWTVKSFDMLLNLLRAAFPHALFPATYNEARRLERGLGFSYEKIHVCPNDCALFWKENAAYNECPKCNSSRWLSSTSKAHKIPQKVLWYFPLKPRLQRLFMSKKTAKDMRWHVEERVDDSTCMTHPADSRVWKDFDNKHSWFSQDARNVRLGLASDGFNPFNNMAKPYSIWPVLLVPYNLPPWLCMKDPYTMLSLLIPGPKAPGNDIDVFLRHLVDELMELWEDGIHTYDAHNGQMFKMHAALLWTINDFPAYANLSGWSTKGKMACPACAADTDSLWLVYGRKHCYMGHRRWLLPDHAWRRKRNAFNGYVDHRQNPSRVTRDDLLHQLLEVSHVQFGKSSLKRKRTPNELNWTKKSIFFKLPYWLHLGLRHNLDVMHIEKNICDNVLGTLLNIEGKTKDSANARRDLENLGLRKELHLQHDGDRISMNLGSYMLNLNERRNFCAWLSEVKFPDGFASNIARCVNVSEGKIKGMKSHDCHIFMQTLLPVVIGGFLRPNVRQALIELSTFFKELCSRTLTLPVLHWLEANIPIILCKLEMIFPLTFFDIMVHLAIHLPEEALLCGPVQYRWMYPFERYLGKFKRYVRNRARPEGSIAEAYIHLECLTFCSMYLHDIESRYNQEERNIDVPVGGSSSIICPSLSVFSQKIRLLGTAISHKLEDTLIAKAICEHYKKIKEEDQNNVERRHQSQFPSWFRSHVRELRANSPNDITDDIYALACGPDPWVASYAGCIMNGIRFHTKERERHRRTQNSGVVVNGEHQGLPMDFYVVLHDIIELRYMGWHKVYLFSCAWWDVGDPRRGIRVKDHLTSVNTARQWYKDEPFALACQVCQVFYLKDPTLGGSWNVVHKITNRNFYNIQSMTLEEDESNDDDESNRSDAIGEGETNLNEYGPILDNDSSMQHPLMHRVDQEPLTVDPLTISPRVMSQPIEDDIFINDNTIDEDIEMENINVGQNSGSEMQHHLDEVTEDDDGMAYPFNLII